MGDAAMFKNTDHLSFAAISEARNHETQVSVREMARTEYICATDTVG